MVGGFQCNAGPSPVSEYFRSPDHGTLTGEPSSRVTIPHDITSQATFQSHHVAFFFVPRPNLKTNCDGLAVNSPWTIRAQAAKDCKYFTGPLFVARGTRREKQEIRYLGALRKSGPH